MRDIEGLLELNKSEGIYIDIGTDVYLEIQGVTFSVTSVFIGLLKDEFMLITLPKKYKSVQSKLYPGNKMVVKYLYEGSVFAFQSSVIEMITTPIRALALEYPKVVQKRELRRNRRRQVVIPGRVEAKKMSFPVMVSDISKVGCQFVFQHNITFREGDALRLYCNFPGCPGEVGSLAFVRNIRRESGTLSIGAKFKDSTDEFITPLLHFIFSIEDFV
ncbi:MAG: flagellar brake protein [Desulfobacterales bacterium]|nr:flagellar brake protein [Desulfobacterales bacterium]